MEDFETLEKEYPRNGVDISDPRFEGSGTLDIARRDTLAALAMNGMLAGEYGKNAWFDLKLTTHTGRHVLLHNALTLRVTMPNSQHEKYYAKIFPNTVVFDSDRLTKAGRVSSIVFQFDRLADFLYYEQIESHFMPERSRKIDAALKGLRKSKILKQYTREFDFFDPMEIYIIHQLPRIFRFRVADRVYEATRGWRASSDFGSDIHIQSQPTLRIGFDKSVSIDEALNAIWAWRRFFSQAAMTPLQLNAIGAQGRGKDRGRMASLYLSNLRRDERRPPPGLDHLPGGTPYFQWRDRAKLGELMRVWLEKEPSRRVFRVALDRVISSIQEQESLEDVGTLCSAIESLPDFDAASPINNAEIKLISRAAIKAAEGAKVAVDSARIYSVMAMLGHQSLPKRMRSLSAALSAYIAEDTLNGVVSSAHSLRQIVSHGRALEDPMMPSVGPTVRALAAMCALYDLTSCGAPAKYGERSLASLSVASHDGAFLRHVAKASTTST